MDVEQVHQPGDEWNTFVASIPNATLGHDAAWHAVLQNAYALEPRYLAVRDANGLRGVLPTVLFRTLRGHRELVSLPFLDAAGILADDPDGEEHLLRAALDLARKLGARALELRQPAPLSSVSSGSPATRVDLVVPLEASEEAQWSKVPRKARNHIRKAKKEGLELFDRGAETLDAFFTPFCVNMRDLGSPTHARSWFAECQAAFGDRFRFIVARRGSRPVGGLVAVSHLGTVIVPWASTLRSERHARPGHLIHWEAIRWAVELGAHTFSFGRSPIGSGTHVFKKGWGAIERPLAWLRLDPEGRPLPVRAPAEDPTLRSLSRLWTLLPVPIANALGGRVRRYIAS